MRCLPWLRSFELLWGISRERGDKKTKKNQQQVFWSKKHSIHGMEIDSELGKKVTLDKRGRIRGRRKKGVDRTPEKCA